MQPVAGDVTGVSWEAHARTHTSGAVEAGLDLARCGSRRAARALGALLGMCTHCLARSVPASLAVLTSSSPPLPGHFLALSLSRALARPPARAGRQARGQGGVPRVGAEQPAGALPLLPRPDQGGPARLLRGARLPAAGRAQGAAARGSRLQARGRKAHDDRAAAHGRGADEGGAAGAAAGRAAPALLADRAGRARRRPRRLQAGACAALGRACARRSRAPACACARARACSRPPVPR